ncbi:MAG: hypothetical protein ACJA1E_000269 [Paracoccaceae bacterium]|jgi:hypothetical protein
MIILGGVPINVTIPPRVVANESGISDKPGLRPALRAVWISTGMNNAKAATLFMKADRTPADYPNQRDVAGQPEAAVDHRARDQENRPRPHKPRRYNQNQRDNKCRGMVKARKRIGRRHDPQLDTCHQRAERHQIIAEFAPQKQRKHRCKKREKQNLIVGHTATKARMMGGAIGLIGAGIVRI